MEPSKFAITTDVYESSFCSENKKLVNTTKVLSVQQDGKSNSFYVVSVDDYLISASDSYIDVLLCRTPLLPWKVYSVMETDCVDSTGMDPWGDLKSSVGKTNVYNMEFAESSLVMETGGHLELNRFSEEGCDSSKSPTEEPTVAPTEAPTTVAPTEAPTTVAPTEAPTTVAPTEAPTTVAPTEAPTTVAPTEAPTTVAPTVPPTQAPTVPPTQAPTVTPTEAPKNNHFWMWLWICCGVVVVLMVIIVLCQRPKNGVKNVVEKKPLIYLCLFRYM